MKKALSLVLALVLTLSMATTVSAATDSGTCGDNLTWKIENGVLTISGTGDMADYSGNAASPWNNKNNFTKAVVEPGVTSIGNSAFRYCTNLLTIELPTSVKVIGHYAFQEAGLVQSPLREGVEVIGMRAFFNCQGLASVTIPSTVREIERYAFENCDNLARVVVESGRKTLSKYMFRDCDTLTDVTIKEGVTSIESYVFSYCFALKNISLPKSVNHIDGSAFYQTTGLKNVYYGGTKADWDNIRIYNEWGSVHFTEYGNSDVNRAKLHLSSTMPPQTAYASTQIITVDGKQVELQAYALLDENGYPTNYVKVRDIAHLLNGTKAQFEVTWDGYVNLTRGKAYTPNGSEMKTPFSGNRNYQLPETATMVRYDGDDLTMPARMDCFMLTDDNGGGYTYYKLRNLGKRLGFYVNWLPEQGIIIDSTRGYDSSTEN